MLARRKTAAAAKAGEVRNMRGAEAGAKAGEKRQKSIIPPSFLCN